MCCSPSWSEFPADEDFKHFELKWKDFGGMRWVPVPECHPALQRDDRHHARGVQAHDGRDWVRTRRPCAIDRATNKAVFLEINPNCGIMYPPGQEGSADWILVLDPRMNHKQFAKVQIEMAVERCNQTQTMYRLDFSQKKGYHLRATRTIKRGTVIFEDEGRPFRLVTKDYVMSHWGAEEVRDFCSSSWPVGRDHHVYACLGTSSPESGSASTTHVSRTWRFQRIGPSTSKRVVTSWLARS